MGSYKLDELHKVVVDGIYIWMRTAARGFRFNRLDYATVLFNFYMLYLEHFSYGADNSQVHRLTARLISPTGRCPAAAGAEPTTTVRG